jgi:hypothetical protein
MFNGCGVSALGSGLHPRYTSMALMPKIGEGKRHASCSSDPKREDYHNLATESAEPGVH